MQSVDGDVRLSVGLDTKSIKQNVNDLGRTMKQSLDSFGSVKGFDALDTKAQQLSIKVEKAAQKISDLRKEIDKVSTVTIPTEEFTTLDSQIGKLMQAYEELNNKREDLKSVINYTAVQERDYQNITSQMQKLEVETDRLISKRVALVESGKAETVDTAKLDELNLKLKQAQTEYNTATQKLQEFQTAQKQPTQSEPIDSTVNKQLKNTVKNSKSAFSKIGKIISSIGGVAKSAFGKVSRIAKSAFSSIISHANRTRKVSGDTFTGMNDAIRKGIKNLLRYGLGIRGTFMLFRKLRNAVKEGLQNLAQYSDEVNGDISGIMSAFTRLKNALATMFQPVLRVISPILTSIIDRASQVATSMGKLIAAFTGQDYVYEAVEVQEDYAASLDKTSKSAKNAKKSLEQYLSPLDDLNRYSAPDTSSDIEETTGADPSKMFKISEVESKFKDMAKKIKDILKSTDWTELGELVGEKLNNILGKIDWTKIIQGARDFATRLYTLINGFVGKVDWTLVGSTIANGIRTALTGLVTFLSGLDFSAIGEAIGNMFNEIVSPRNAKLLATALSKLFSGALTTLISLIRTFDWAKVSNTIIAFLSKFDFRKISSLAASLLNSIATALSRIDFKAIGKAFSDGLSKIQWGKIWDGATRVVSNLIQAIADMFGLRGVNTTPLSRALRDIKTPIADTLKQLKDATGKILTPIVNKLLPSAVKLIGSIVKAASPIISALSPVIGKIIETLSNIITALSPVIERIGGVISKIIETISPFLEPVLGLISKIVEVLAPVLDVILGLVEAILTPIIRINEEIVGIFSTLLGTNEGTVSEELAAEISNLSTVSEGLSTISDNIDTALSNVDQSLEETQGDLQYIDDLKDRMKQLLEQSTLTDSDMTELNTIADLISEKVPEFQQAWDEMVQKDEDGKLQFTKSKDEMINSLDDVINKLKEQYATEALQEQYKQLYAEKIKSNQEIATATQNVINAQDGLNGAVEKYNQAMQAQADAGETFGPLADATRDAQAGVDAYAKELETAQENLLVATAKQQEFDTKLSALGNTLDVVSGKYTANNKNLQALRDAYENGFIDIDSLKRNFKVSEEELYKGTLGMADRTARGYELGINKATSALTESGMVVGESALAGARESLGIHSPSKEFENVALNSVQGATNGFIKYRSMLIEAVKTTAQLMTNAMRTSLQNFGSVFDTIPNTLKSRLNYALDMFSDFLTYLTSGLNNLLTQINRINQAFATAGGKNNSYTIWHNLPNIQIPRLAQGAVIPPNREFLAVLGDQSRGNNIEAPESLIRQIIRDEIGNQSNTRNVYEIPLVIGGRTISKLVIDEARLMQTQTGKNPFELA